MAKATVAQLVRMPPDVAARLETEAERRGISKNQLTVFALRVLLMPDAPVMVPTKGQQKP